MENYKHLHTYTLATVINDLTAEFCFKFIDRKSRTLDQMVQAARSGKQNIAEGSSGQSLETYIRLLGVAEGSFKELAADYEDYLRQKQLMTWPKDDRRLKNVRQFRAEWLAPNVPNTPNLPVLPEAAANALLNLCAVETYMLGRQIAALKDRFVKNGGFRESLRAEPIKYKQSGKLKWQHGEQRYQGDNGTKNYTRSSNKANHPSPRAQKSYEKGTYASSHDIHDPH